MTENPLISVVIPTYNRPQYLKKAITTVLKQTYTNIEIIIIDDSSQTDTQSVIAHFNDDRIKYFKNKKQMGAPYSRNIGIKKSIGNYIAFLDDDDEWKPTKLEKQLEEVNNEKVGLVICYSLDKRFGMTRISKPLPTVSYNELLKSFNLSSTSSYLVRKKAIDIVGDFDLTLPSAQEYDLAIRIAEKFVVKTVPEILMIQNASVGQISTNWTKKIRGILALYSKYNQKYCQLGFLSGTINHIKVSGLVGLFFCGFIFGNKIYQIITPFKKIYESI